MADNQHTAPARPAGTEIAAGVPERAQAPLRVQPTGPVTRDEALALLAASREKLIAAARVLDPERALFTISASLVGSLSLYQVGEWVAVHVIRHNKQMKRLLEE
ncbi:MAG TPA: DinB family protein [Vicinamibacterales bacterium]|nr:DinB family protein [Vicinamibacterales bacterium]